MSSLINKVKEAVHSDKKDNAATDNPRSDNAGPHGSNMANKVDPRVDSDRDNYNTPGVGGGYGAGGAGGVGQGMGGAGHHGAGGGYNDPNVGGGPGGSYGGPGNPQSGNAGPHSSNLANRADPRVDSNLDGSRTVGGNNQGYGGANTGAGYGHSGGVGGGMDAGYGGPGNPQSTNAGPHGSNFANRADPRVDSDMDGSRNMGAAGAGGQGFGGQAGYGGPGNPQSSNAGPHSSNLANRADPRVDSDMDGGRHAGLGTSGAGHTTHTGYDQGGPGGYNQGGPGGAAGGYGSSATPGSGNAAGTAGPHNSNLLNKLDPRVDSDMDGSKTYGGNQTHR